MKITSKQYANSLYDSIENKDKKEVRGIIDNFFDILVANNDISKIKKIIEEFDVIWNNKKGIVNARIETAQKISNSVMKMLNNYIKNISNAKEVNINVIEDKNILGGVVIKYEDKILDGSLRARIEDLKNQMIK